MRPGGIREVIIPWMGWVLIILISLRRLFYFLGLTGLFTIRSGGTCKTEIFNLGTKYMYLYIALFWASTKYMYFVVFQKNPAQSTSTSNLTWNRIFRYKSTSFLDIFWSKSCILNSRFWHRVLHTIFSSKVYVLSKFGTIFRE